MIHRSLLFSFALAVLTTAGVQAGPPAVTGSGRGARRAAEGASVARVAGQPAELVSRVGESRVLPFHWITKVVLGNPAVADVVPVSDDELVLNGKAPGRTNLFVWDRTGRSEYEVVVTSADQAPAPDLPAVAAEVARELANPQLQVNAIGDTLFLSGSVATPEAKALAGAVAAAHGVKVQNFVAVAEAPRVTPSAADVAGTLNRIFDGTAVSARVIDDHTVALEGNVENKDSQEQMRKVAESVGAGLNVVCYFHPANPRMRQVLIHARVLDVDRFRMRQLGFDWGSVLRSAQGGITITQPFVFGQAGAKGPFEQLLGVGTAINALEQQNAVRVLSEPNLLVMEGNQGHVLIGGEIPVPVPQPGGGGTTVTIEYKPYGIKLDVDVLGIDDRGISMQVQPEVSDLDFGNAVKLDNFVIPALRTRRADSTVRIRSGETLAIGGLMSQQNVQFKNAIPLLSKIPVLGEFFKSRTMQKDDRELVILVTPEVKEDK